MRDFEGSINTFLEGSSTSSKKIIELLKEIKTKSNGKDGHIQDMDKALKQLVKGLNNFKKTFESYHKKTIKRGKYAERK